MRAATALAWLMTVGAALPAERPVLRAVGVHVFDPAAGRSRWFGPGGHPAWSPDGRRLYLEAHHGLTSEPPFGPLYFLEAATLKARGLTGAPPLGCAKVSLSGRRLAALAWVGGEQAAVGVVSAETGLALGEPLPLGPLRPELADAYAWHPSAEALYFARAAGSLSAGAGVYRIDLPDGEPRAVVAGQGADGVWPSPDGTLLAIRVGRQVTVARPDHPEVPVQERWSGAEDETVVGLAWAGESLWLDVRGGVGPRLIKCAPAGEPPAVVTVPGEPLSPLTVAGETAWYLGRLDGQPGLLALNLADGTVQEAADIEPELPLELGNGWSLPAPAVAADGRVAVALGRTDRWGQADRDLTEGWDVLASGKTVAVLRRGRNVGASGVVFESPQCGYAGRRRPAPDSPVAADRRAGTMRWSRPVPPRFVVLHHTATTSDRGSLNALTSPSDGLLARLYEDVTPGSRLPGEPRTIGVHYLVLRSGAVLQLAEEKHLTRHAGIGQWGNQGPIYDFNVDTIGIEIVAKGHDFTGGQVANVGRLVADICRRQAIPLQHVGSRPFEEGVLYHKDFAGGLRGKPDPAGWPWTTMMRYAQQYRETDR